LVAAGVEELRHAIEAVLTDPDRRARLIELGRARAASWPDTDAVLDELVATYLDLNPNLRPAG